MDNRGVRNKKTDPRVDVFNKTQALLRLTSVKPPKPPFAPKRKIISKATPKIIQEKFSWSGAIIPTLIFVVAFIISAGIGLMKVYSSYTSSFYRYSYSNTPAPEDSSNILTIIIICSAILTLVWIPFRRSSFKRKQKRKITKIKKSEEYKNYCIELEEKYLKDQRQADIEYKNKMEIYERETLTEYNKILEAWQIAHNNNIEKARLDLEIAKTALTG